MDFQAHQRPQPRSPQPGDLAGYGVDFGQRSVLFWDTLRQRGNNFVEHNARACRRCCTSTTKSSSTAASWAAGQLRARADIAAGRRQRSIPSAARTSSSIRAPATVRHRRLQGRSQVGVALHAGTRSISSSSSATRAGPDAARVCEAEAGSSQAAARIRQPKPCVIGNCQGGWAAMMLAAADPEMTGPIVINGAPMSYWGGRRGRQPDALRRRPARRQPGRRDLSRPRRRRVRRRLSGQNFENLNPANTFWESTTTCSPTSTPRRRASSSSSAGGAATT